MGEYEFNPYLHPPWTEDEPEKMSKVTPGKVVGLIVKVVAGLAGLALFIFAVAYCSNTMVADDRRDHIATCKQLNSEPVFAKDGSYLCVRDGEVIYPN